MTGGVLTVARREQQYVLHEISLSFDNSLKFNLQRRQSLNNGVFCGVTSFARTLVNPKDWHNPFFSLLYLHRIYPESIFFDKMCVVLGPFEELRHFDDTLRWELPVWGQFLGCYTVVFVVVLLLLVTDGNSFSFSRFWPFVVSILFSFQCFSSFWQWLHSQKPLLVKF